MCCIFHASEEFELTGRELVGSDFSYDLWISICVFDVSTVRSKYASVVSPVLIVYSSHLFEAPVCHGGITCNRQGSSI